jgi:hypothetical protein
MTEELSYVLINNDEQRYIEVPVHKATRVFFQREFGHKNEFVRARMDNLLGSCLLMVTEKPLYRKVLLRKRSRECKLKVILPQEVMFGKVTAERALAVGKMLDAIYRHQFFCFVKGAVATGCSENFAVIRFLELYKINEDVWALDTAKKAWRDYKGRGAP